MAALVALRRLSTKSFVSDSLRCSSTTCLRWYSETSSGEERNTIQTPSDKLILGEMVSGNVRLVKTSSTKPDHAKPLPLLLRRIRIRGNDLDHKTKALTAREVLKARTLVYHGVSTLLHFVPVWKCKHCPAVHVGEKGHIIQTCPGYHQPTNKSRLEKDLSRSPRMKVKGDKVHKWVPGSMDDILVPVQAIHRPNMFFDSTKASKSKGVVVPAAVELCVQADPNLDSRIQSFSHVEKDVLSERIECLSNLEMKVIATGTYQAWQKLRAGVQKLLKHTVKVEYSKNEVGQRSPFGTMRILDSSRRWEKLHVNDLVPRQTVWCQRPQDPLVLVDEGRKCYIQAPAVMSLCMKAGAYISPSQYSGTVKWKVSSYSMAN